MIFHKRINWLLQLMVCCLVALGLSNQVSAETFYVSPIGSDSNPGTEADPFLTLGKSQAMVRAALPSATEGIQVWVRGGTYY